MGKHGGGTYIFNECTKVGIQNVKKSELSVLTGYLDKKLITLNCAIARPHEYSKLCTFSEIDLHAIYSASRGS